MSAPRKRYRRGVLPAESEAAFQQKVEQLAGHCGWRIYHTHDSRRSAAGFPDLVMVRDVRLIFAELKSDIGARRARVADVDQRPGWLQLPELTNAQADWLQALEHVAARVASYADTAIDAVSAGITFLPVPPSIEVYVWRPGGWTDVEAALRR